MSPVPRKMAGWAFDFWQTLWQLDIWTLKAEAVAHKKILFYFSYFYLFIYLFIFFFGGGGLKPNFLQTKAFHLLILFSFDVLILFSFFSKKNFWLKWFMYVILLLFLSWCFMVCLWRFFLHKIMNVFARNYMLWS